MSDRAELELLRQQQGALPSPTADPRAELELLRQQQGASPSPSPGPGITFVNNAEGQGYAPKPQRSAVEDVGRSIGLAARSYGPLAVATGAGALAGGLPGAGAGAAAYGLTKLVGDPVVGLYNYAKPESWTPLTPPTQALNSVLDSFLPKPETPGERIADSVNQAIADSVGITGLPSKVFKAAEAGAPAVNQGIGGVGTYLQNLQNPVAQGVGRVIAENPAQQAVLSAISGLGYGTAREVAPDMPAAQFVAGLAAPFAATAGMNAVRSGINFLGPENIGAFFSGGREAAAQNYANNQVAQRLQTQVGTQAEKDTAIQALDQGGPLTANGYRPTTGTLSANPNLISIEKRLSNNGDAKGSAGESLLSRSVKNAEAITGGVNSTLKPGAVSPEVAQNYIGGQLNQRVLSAEDVVKIAEDAVRRAAAELAAEQASLYNQGAETVRNTAAKNVRGSLETQNSEFKAMADELFKKVPDKVDVPLKTSINVAKRLVKAAGDDVGNLPPSIQKFLDIAAKNKNSLKSKNVQDNLSSLYADMQEVPKASPALRKLELLRDALDRDINRVGEVAKPLREARDFYRDQFVPRFRQGASFPIFKQRGAGGADAVTPENTVNGFWENETEAGRLRSALGGQSGELDPKDISSVRDWAVSQMMSRFGPNVKPEQIADWARANSARLAKWPEVQKEVNQLSQNLGKSSEKVNALGQVLETKKAELSSVKDTATKSNPAKFSQGGAEGAVADVDGWLYSNRAGNRAKELVEAAKADKSGQAMEGLRNSIKESVTRRVRARGTVVGEGNDINAVTPESFPTTMAKMNTLLQSGPTRRAMEMVFTPEELSSLDQIRKQVAVSNRINTKATSGSDTASLTTAGELDSQINKIYWGLPGIRAVKILKSIADGGKALGRAVVMKDPEKVTQQLLVDAMLEPKLARALLMRESEKTLPMVKQAIEPWLNNWLQNNGGETDVTGEPKSRTQRMLEE